MQALASPSQRRHDGADWNCGDGGDFLVRAAFELAKDENLAETRGQSFESAGKALSVVAGDGEGFGRHARLLVQFFVEFAHELHRAVLLQPGIAGIAHNLQKPGSCVAAVKPTKKTAGTEQGLLCNIF